MSISFEISEIDVDTASQTLSIVWNDGETSFFPFRRVTKGVPLCILPGWP